MKYPENIKLFTIKEVSKACGVSRTTLIRMEESGFLKPYRIDPDSGYRYYDASNITAIGQYQFLQELGISRSEIADLYYKNIDTDKFLEEQKAKVYRLSRLINQLEMRLNHDLNFTTSYVDLPEMVCYCFKANKYTTDDMEMATYDRYGQCIKEGMHVCGSEPISLTYEHDWSKPFDMNEVYEMEICFPVSDPVEARSEYRLFPATRGFSMLCFGDYSEIPAFGERLYQEINTRGLKVTGATRMISLVAPYTGTHFKPSDFCSQWIVPVED